MNTVNEHSQYVLCSGLFLTCFGFAAAVKNVFRDSEPHTHHVLVWCHVTHKMHGALVLQREPEAAGRPLHHVRLRIVMLRETVAVHCGKVLVACRLWLQEAPESVQKLQRQRRQVHDHMDRRFPLQQSRHLPPQRPADEVSAVQIEGLDFALHLVEFAVVLQPSVRLRVEIVGQNFGAEASGRDGEGSDPGEDVEHDVATFNQLHHSLVLCAQPGVPVDARKVKLISHAVFFHLQGQKMRRNSKIQNFQNIEIKY